MMEKRGEVTNSPCNSKHALMNYSKYGFLAQPCSLYLLTSSLPIARNPSLQMVCWAKRNFLFFFTNGDPTCSLS